MLRTDFQCFGLSTFNMTWQNFTQNHTSYLVNIRPSEYISTSGTESGLSFKSITLRNDISYHFTLSWADCPDILNVTYELGKLW